MTTFLLIRHGETDAIGKSMMGWMPGWHLNANGKQQVAKLAERLARLPIRAVYASPLERAIETAEPIARVHGLAVQPVDDLGEVHMGSWQGLSMAELDRREDWRKFNTYRGGARPPGGEMMIEVQTRIIRELHCLEERHPAEIVAVVSHGDPLRSAAAYYLGIPLDLMLRFEIAPASVTAVEVADWGPRVLCLNETGDVPL
jgi:broad specificity phosphatase PhoE